jgi:ubiquinone/menaquinone biosynthesis C-methylase UbiE
VGGQAKDNTYDAAYQIEATCHAPDYVGVYKEILRVLKPGGVFAGYEWCMTVRASSSASSDPIAVSLSHSLFLCGSLKQVRRAYLSLSTK